MAVVVAVVAVTLVLEAVAGLRWLLGNETTWNTTTISNPAIVPYPSFHHHSRRLYSKLLTLGFLIIIFSFYSGQLVIIRDTFNEHYSYSISFMRVVFMGDCRFIPHLHTRLYKALRGRGILQGAITNNIDIETVA